MDKSSWEMYNLLSESNALTLLQCFVAQMYKSVSAIFILRG